MAAYRNDYSKKDDFCLWELHQIRNKLAKKNESIAQINKNANDNIRKYKLTNLRVR